MNPRLTYWLHPSRWSIGRRVAFTATLATLLCLTAGGIVLDRMVAATLRSEIDAALGAAGSALLARTQRDQDGTWRFAGAPDFPRKARPDAWEIHAPDGHLLASSFEHAGHPPMTVVRPATSKQPHAAWGEIDGEAMMLMSWQKNADEPWVTVARECEDSEDLQEAFRYILLAVGAVAACATAAAILVSVRRGLRPLRELSAQITALDGERLDRRIVLNPCPIDIQPVVDRLNEWLERLATAFVRERAFTADVAHELRNPLGAMRLDLESALAVLTDDNALRPGVVNAHQACLHLHGLVERLLVLARLESGELAKTLVDTDAAALLASVWAERAADAQQRGLTMHGAASSPVILRTDPERLRAVLRNLIDNAIAHPDPGARLDAHITPRADGMTELSVSTTGCRLSAEDATRACDRLWRGDPGRGDTGRHHGLGLALCRRLVQSLGGTLDITIADGRFTVLIVLPAVPPR